MLAAQGRVTSTDGTAITFERAGAGPALVMVDPAGGWSGFDNIRGLGRALASDLTVFTYDRRGRGTSGDRAPYAVEREIEDLEAVIGEAGGSASVYGFSSGALVALHGAAAGLAIRKLVLFEPPIREAGEPPDVAFADRLATLIAEGRRAEAVTLFLTSIGVPDEVIEGMGPARDALEAVAHTLVYDAEISNAMTDEVIRSVPVPTLVLDSQGSSDDLTGGTAALVAALPNAIRRSLAGEWHGVPDEVLAPVVKEFLGA